MYSNGCFCCAVFERIIKKRKIEFIVIESKVELKKCLAFGFIQNRIEIYLFLVQLIIGFYEQS